MTARRRWITLVLGIVVTAGSWIVVNQGIQIARLIRDLDKPPQPTTDADIIGFSKSNPFIFWIDDLTQNRNLGLSEKTDVANQLVKQNLLQALAPIRKVEINTKIKPDVQLSLQTGMDPVIIKIEFGETDLRFHVHGEKWFYTGGQPKVMLKLLKSVGIQPQWNQTHP